MLGDLISKSPNFIYMWWINHKLVGSRFLPPPPTRHGHQEPIPGAPNSSHIVGWEIFHAKHGNSTPICNGCVIHSHKWFGKFDLGVVYIMDHDVVPRPYKICGWLLNSSWNHFIVHQGKNVRWPWNLRFQKRHVLRPSLSTNMIQYGLQWKRQKRCSGRKKRQEPMIEKYCYDKFLMISSWAGREDKDKRRQKNGQTWFFFSFKHVFIGHIFKKPM